jgi:hypothetical protein
MVFSKVMARRRPPLWQRELNYLSLVLLHIGIGAFIYFIPPFVSLLPGRHCLFLLQDHHHRQKQKALLGAFCLCLYRCRGVPLSDDRRWLVLRDLQVPGHPLCLFGLFYDGISGRGYPYFIYLIALVPAVVLASINLSYDLRFRSSVAFVLSAR